MEEILGVPVLFSKKLFSKLASLNKDEGARKIINTYDGPIGSVSFPNGVEDLDTLEAYHAFLNKMGYNVDNY